MLIPDSVELGERKLALEVARSREEQAERRQANVEKRDAARAARSAKAKEATEAGEVGGEAEGDGEGKKKKRSPKVRHLSSHHLIMATS